MAKQENSVDRRNRTVPAMITMACLLIVVSLIINNLPGVKPGSDNRLGIVLLSISAMLVLGRNGEPWRKILTAVGLVMVGVLGAAAFMLIPSDGKDSGVALIGQFLWAIFVFYVVMRLCFHNGKRSEAYPLLLLLCVLAMQNVDRWLTMSFWQPLVRPSALIIISWAMNISAGLLLGYCGLLKRAFRQKAES